MSPARPIVLHGFPLSGHSHRAELMLSLLGLPYELRVVDLAKGEQRRPEFLALNPFGTVPVVEDDGAVVADSTAILVYLASRYDEARRWLPAEPRRAAEVQRWLSVAQGPVFNGPCAARLIAKFGRPLDPARARMVAEQLFATLDAWLAERRFLADGAAPTIADVAVYSYVALAPEGGLDLAPYANLRAWLARLEDLPRFLPLPGRAPQAA
jgi:glutathione S-transferase